MTKKQFDGLLALKIWCNSDLDMFYLYVLTKRCLVLVAFNMRTHKR